MKLAYLGDALDHWKGSLFEFLEGEGLLRDVDAADVGDAARNGLADHATMVTVRDIVLAFSTIPLLMRCLLDGEAYATMARTEIVFNTN